MPSKEGERADLESFLRSRPDLGLRNPENSESPDFLFNHSGSRLGIELTRFSPPRDGSKFVPHEQDSLRKRVMGEARRVYEEAGGAPLHVDAIFNDHRPLKPSRVPELADELSEYLGWKAAGVPVYKEVPFSVRDKYPYLVEIAHVTAFRVPEPSYGIWYAGQGGWVSQASEDDFARILMEKEPRVTTYLKNCDNVWLVVVFDTMAGADHVESPATPGQFNLPTEFQRVFSLDRIGDRSVEIPCRRRDAMGSTRPGV